MRGGDRATQRSSLLAEANELSVAEADKDAALGVDGDPPADGLGGERLAPEVFVALDTSGDEFPARRVLRLGVTPQGNAA